MNYEDLNFLFVSMYHQVIKKPAIFIIVFSGMVRPPELSFFSSIKELLRIAEDGIGFLKGIVGMHVNFHRSVGVMFQLLTLKLNRKNYNY